MLKVGFYSPHLSLRGTEVAMYDYTDPAHQTAISGSFIDFRLSDDLISENWVTYSPDDAEEKIRSLGYQKNKNGYWLDQNGDEIFMSPKIVNFGPDDDDIKPVSWIVKEITNMWNSNVEVDYNTSNLKHETNFLKLDCSKAKSKLKWAPKIKLEQGLQLTGDWYKQYEQKKELKEFTQNQIEEYVY